MNYNNANNKLYFSSYNLANPMMAPNIHLNERPTSNMNVIKNDMNYANSMVYPQNNNYGMNIGNSAQVQNMGYPDPYSRQNLRMNVLETRLNNFSTHRQDERASLREVISKNMFNNQMQPNKSMDRSRAANNINNSYDNLGGNLVGFYNPYAGSEFDQPVMGIKPKEEKKTIIQKGKDINGRNLTQKRKSTKMTQDFNFDKESLQEEEEQVKQEEEEEEQNEEIQNSTPHQELETSDSEDSVKSYKAKRRKDAIQSKLDTMAAVEEITDSLDLFKLEMANNIKKIQRSQEKLRIGDVIDELADFREHFRETMDRTNRQGEREVKDLKEGFRNVKEELGYKVAIELDKNKSVLEKVVNEMKNYQEDIKKKINEMEDKQKLQIEGLKYIIDNTGDYRTRELAEKFMNGNREDFEKNKNKFLVPTKDQLEEYIAGQRGRRDTMNPEGELDTKIRKTRMKNDHYAEWTSKLDDYRDIPMDANDLGGLNRLRNENKSKRLMLDDVNKNIDSIINASDKTVGKLGQLKKFVHAVMLCQKCTKLLKARNNSIVVNTLNDFSTNFIPIDNIIKDWVNDSTKQAFLSITNFDGLKIDIAEFSSLTFKKDNIELKDRYIKLEMRLKSFVDTLISNTTRELMDPKIVNFLNLITTSNSCIPFKFFSLFELSRLEITDSVLITNIKEKQLSMIVCFYVIIRILVKHILLEQNFVPLDKRRSMNNNVKKNFKTVASIIYNDTIDLFRKHCTIVNNQITDIQGYIKSQYSFFENKNNPLIEEQMKKLAHEKADKSYLAAMKKYYEKSSRRTGYINENSFDEIKKNIESINSKIVSNKDMLISEVEYISASCYKMSDLSAYYTMAKENNFDLQKRIYMWVKCVWKVMKDK